MLRQIVDGIPDMMNTIEALRNRRMDNEEAYAFAKQAVELRWDYVDNVYAPVNAGTYATVKTVREALSAKRAEDNFADAWTVFNRVQENVLRGNVFINSVTKDDNGDMRMKERKARPLSSISEHVRTNQKMFDLIAA